MYRSRLYRGLTLVELLVSTTLALLIIYAVVHVFAQVGQEISASRATFEITGQTRNIKERIARDLKTVSLPVRPWPELSSSTGYFEYVEGPANDKHANPSTNPADFLQYGAIGDTDDILMFTAYSRDEPFQGAVNGQPVYNAATNRFTIVPDGTLHLVEAYAAEIVYWTSFNDANGNNRLDVPEERLQLHRRVLLIRPDFDFTETSEYFYQNNDISVRRVGTTNAVVANSLADLTQRENRFGHDQYFTGPFGTARNFPNPVTHANLNKLTLTSPTVTPAPHFDRLGEDVIVAEITAFDVQVYDPRAPNQSRTLSTAVGAPTIAVTPSDNGFDTSNTAPTIAEGAFVNLRYGGSIGLFNGLPNTRSQLTTPTYDTWSWHYERDNVNQDGDELTDEGTNHLDDAYLNTNVHYHLIRPSEPVDTSNPMGPQQPAAPPANYRPGAYGIDDETERETSPPYPVPLRGIQVTVRVVDLDHHNVKQIAVEKYFTPQ